MRMIRMQEPRICIGPIPRHRNFGQDQLGEMGCSLPEMSTHLTNNLLFPNADMNTTASAHVLIGMIRITDAILKVSYLDEK